MSLAELFLLAVGLSMDAFAVAVCKGLALGKAGAREMLIPGAWFGVFQALMPLIGWFLGARFEKYIVSVDHWIAFLLLGMPLAVRTSRRETSVGLFLSVLLAGIYFGGVLISDALRESPKLYPQYLVWIPPALFQIFGAVYIFKIARR